MRRREFIVLVGCAAATRPIEARAQQPGKKVYRVGLLSNGVVIDERRRNLVSALGAQGFVEGQNLIFEERSADAQPRRLDALMGELKAPTSTSLSLLAIHRRWRQKIQPGVYPSSLPVRAIRLRPVWSMGWRGLAATLPA